MGEGGCIITPSFTSRTLRIMSVATKHTGHDRFIASRGAIPSQISPPLFTELRTSRMTLRVHVGVSEFLLPVTPGQAGSAPAESSIEFRFLVKSALFYCVFLRGLSRNKARFFDYEQPPALYFLDLLAMMGLFIAIFYYLGRTLQRCTNRPARRNIQ